MYRYTTNTTNALSATHMSICTKEYSTSCAADLNNTGFCRDGTEYGYWTGTQSRVTCHDFVQHECRTMNDRCDLECRLLNTGSFDDIWSLCKNQDDQPECNGDIDYVDYKDLVTLHNILCPHSQGVSFVENQPVYDPRNGTLARPCKTWPQVSMQPATCAPECSPNSYCCKDLDVGQIPLCITKKCDEIKRDVSCSKLV